MNRKELTQKRRRRARRSRAKVGKGTEARPRLSVFRSNRYIYAQLIDDMNGKTLVSVSSHEVKKSKNKTETAKAVGKITAEKAAKADIKEVIFDKGSYDYHGRIKALAEAARENGLKF